MTFSIFLSSSLDRAAFIIKQIIDNKDLLWILAPIIVSLILMELYFGRYEREELGWNTAFGNSLILIFVSANLVNHMRSFDLWGDPIKLGVLITLVSVGIFLTFIDYFHALPESWAFAISSKLPMSFISFMASLFVYIKLPADSITLGAFGIILIASYIVISIMHFLTPTFKGLLSRDVPEPME
jgi:hypothetical protein